MIEDFWPWDFEGHPAVATQEDALLHGRHILEAQDAEEEDEPAAPGGFRAQGITEFKVWL